MALDQLRQGYAVNLEISEWVAAFRGRVAMHVLELVDMNSYETLPSVPRLLDLVIDPLSACRVGPDKNQEVVPKIRTGSLEWILR